MPVLPISTSIASRSSAAISSPGSAASPGSRARTCGLPRMRPLLAAAEPDIVTHMNADHADAVRLYASNLLGRAGEGWRMTGIDPEGLDLRRQSETDGETARLDFPEPVLHPGERRGAFWSPLPKRRGTGGPDLAARLRTVSPQSGCLPRQCAGPILSVNLSRMRRAWRMPGVNGGKLGSGGQTLACACSPLRPRRARDAPSSPGALEPDGAVSIRTCGAARRRRYRVGRQLLSRIPDAIPAARRATNTSSTSPAPRTRSIGARSTSRSSRPSSTVCTQRMLAYLQGRELFVQDLYAGADPEYRLPVRVVSPSAWHSLFARNMFIRPPAAELADFQPAFTILHAPDFRAIPELDGIRSETFIFVNFAVASGADRRHPLCRRNQEIGVRLSEFRVAGARRAADALLGQCRTEGRRAIFFGLSGTGKTTLSADASRTLIGDDEHGWSPKGIFNFEGGCYAKVINLSPTAEPEIYATITRFGTVLENVVLDPLTRMPDVDDASLTENTRACYPLDFIPNADPHGLAPHPKNVDHADLRCVRRHAADRQAQRRTGDVSFPVRLYGAGRRHRGRARQGAEGGVLDLLRRAVHAAASVGLRPDAARPDRALRRRLLARQHRLVGRRLRGRPAHGDRAHPRAVARRARRQPRRRADAAGPEFRVPGAGKRRRNPEQCARSAPHLARRSAATTRSRAVCAGGSKAISSRSSRMSTAR